MARTTVFGAGAMGTAFAMHLCRLGHETTLWASPFDGKVLVSLREARRHPALPEHLPESLELKGPDELEEAASGVELSVMGAHAAGARSLARAVKRGSKELPLVVAVAKGLEPGSAKRMSQVYSEELGHDRVVCVGGPCLAPEVAQGLPTASVFASADQASLRAAAEAFAGHSFQVSVTDDLAGVEYCTVAKNVVAIGVGILDGLAKASGLGHRNAKAALFTQGFAEMARLVVALGGRTETVGGLAGLGDSLVTSLGGRNRLFGEMVGEGASPKAAVDELAERGLTVEGWDSARDVQALAGDLHLSVPYLSMVAAILFDSAPPESLLDCLKG